GWAAFAITSDRVRAHALPRLPEPEDSAQAASLLLAPFDDEIEASKSVVVLPMGPLLDVDFASLPWRGDALIANRALGWKLDAGGAARAGTLECTALVVGDPATRVLERGRLPVAAGEGDAVARALRARGFDAE